MAREPRTMTELERIRDDVQRAVDALDRGIKRGKEAGMPFATIHATTVLTRYAPAFIEWAFRTQADLESQAFAFRQEQARAAAEKEAADAEAAKKQPKSRKKRPTD